MGKAAEAEEVYRSLLRFNNDCRAYYLALEGLRENKDLVGVLRALSVRVYVCMCVCGRRSDGCVNV